MSPSPEPVRQFQLTLSSQPGSELFVIDSSFGLAARGVDRLSVSLPEGVYKLKVRRGRQEREEPLLLTQDETRTIDAPALASAAPLEGTTRTHETHVAAAAQLSHQVHVHAGSGGQIFLMSRYWTSPRRAHVDGRAHPANGLSLRTLDGRTVVDYQASAIADLGSSDPFAACTVEVDPGTYVIRRATAEGRVVEQTVVASGGWQTEVFILKDPVLAEPVPDDPGEASDQLRTVRPDAISVLMCRGGFEPGRTDLQAVEVARLALVDERRVLSNELSAMLDSKFENPFLGILAAHLLVIAHDREAVDARDPRHAHVQPGVDTNIDGLEVIVNNLRGLLGGDHPDVEALSLRLPNWRQRSRVPFAAPPMLKRSWSLMVAASNDRPDLVPKQLYSRVKAFVVAPPYFVWAAAEGRTSDPARRLASADTKFRAAGRSRKSPAGAVRGRGRGLGRGHASGAAAALVGRGGGGPQLEFLIPPGGLEGIAIAGDEAPVQPKGPTEREMRSLSVDSDIPRGALDRAFRRD